jgi:hypothetical protein
MQTCAYLINTTPNYFYLLPLHITLLHRYSNIDWPIYIATEAKALLPELPSSVNIIDLPADKEGFWDSRAEAVRRLPAHIKYVLPMQEDFLLEGRPMTDVIVKAITLMENHPISSMRLMPCPGPKGLPFQDTPWLKLEYPYDYMLFTYQATLWRREDYVEFMDLLIKQVSQNPESQNRIAIKMNLAEIEKGQLLMKGLGKLHLAWPREGAHPNAVYLCPWPYRPTAVVRGTLEPWAAELMSREGFSLKLVF